MTYLDFLKIAFLAIALGIGILVSDLTEPRGPGFIAFGLVAAIGVYVCARIETPTGSKRR